MAPTWPAETGRYPVPSPSPDGAVPRPPGAPERPSPEPAVRLPGTAAAEATSVVEAIATA